MPHCCTSLPAGQHYASVQQQTVVAAQRTACLQHTITSCLPPPLHLPPSAQDMSISTTLRSVFTLPLSELGTQNYMTACKEGQEQAEKLMGDALITLGFTGGEVRAVCCREHPYMRACTQPRPWLSATPATMKWTNSSHQFTLQQGCTLSRQAPAPSVLAHQSGSKAPEPPTHSHRPPWLQAPAN